MSERVKPLPKDDTLSFKDDSFLKSFTNVKPTREKSEQNLHGREKKKRSLRSRILALAREPNSVFLDTEDFCAALNIEFPRYRGYVRALRFHPGAKP